MSRIKDVLVPDIGEFDAVEVIEVLVKSGDTVAVEDPLITMESDKASMDVPSPLAGTVKDLKINAGDKVSQNDLILTLKVEESAQDTAEMPAETTEKTSPQSSSSTSTTS
ncbi:MAG: biotin/lipoyl-containing protein, partial [SAR324 cluster bacterium]|nr:biotin/lipoyl-containing protein [SAR324 cluster bacterium]